MRQLFYSYLKDPACRRNTENPMLFLADKTGICMSYWYGGLYVVIEGWTSLELSDPKIDQLLDSPNVDLLRRYRNGSFHFQNNWLDPKLSDFCGSSRAVQWVNSLTDEFRRVLIGEMNRRNAQTGIA
jgi:hypothetical protein